MISFAGLGCRKRKEGSVRWNIQRIILLLNGQQPAPAYLGLLHVRKRLVPTNC
jgi:hypothetical protein